MYVYQTIDAAQQMNPSHFLASLSKLMIGLLPSMKAV